LDKETEEYYETYFSLFSSKGWKQLIEELTESFDAFRIEDIKDQQELDLVKGQRLALRRLINFETAIRSAYDSILESGDD